MKMLIHCRATRTTTSVFYVYVELHEQEQLPVYFRCHNTTQQYKTDDSSLCSNRRQRAEYKGEGISNDTLPQTIDYLLKLLIMTNTLCFQKKVLNQLETSTPLTIDYINKRTNLLTYQGL